MCYFAQGTDALYTVAYGCSSSRLQVFQHYLLVALIAYN